MIIKTAEFVKSSSKVSQCPNDKLPEYAFIGRSNVGKSSLINMLVNHKGLAKTSGSPGKTQTINHFIINNNWFLVDLPGYGYAKSAKTERAAWSIMIEEYLKNRENLMCTFVLIDARHEPQKSDMDFMQTLGENGIPFVMVFTKIDKISALVLSKNIANYKRKMKLLWEELPQMFQSSNVTKSGKEEILDFIEQTNKLYNPTTNLPD